MKKNPKEEAIKTWLEILKGRLGELSKLKRFEASVLTEIGVTPSHLRFLGMPQKEIVKLGVREEVLSLW